MEKIVKLLGKELPEENKLEEMCKTANISYNKLKVIIDEFNDDKEFVTDNIISEMYKNNSNKSRKVAEILNVLTFAHIDICESEDKEIDSQKYMNDIDTIISESNFKNIDRFYKQLLEYLSGNKNDKFSLDTMVDNNQGKTDYVDKLISKEGEGEEEKSHVTVTINKTMGDKVLDIIEEINEETDDEKDKETETKVVNKEGEIDTSKTEENDNSNPIVELLNAEEKNQDDEIIDGDIKNKISDIKNKIPLYLKSLDINIPEKYLEKISYKLNQLVDILSNNVIEPSDKNSKELVEFIIYLFKYIISLSLPKYIKVSDIVTSKKENEIRNLLKEATKNITINKNDFDMNCSDEIKNKLMQILEETIIDVKTQTTNMKKIKVTPKPKYEGIYNIIHLLQEESK